MRSICPQTDTRVGDINVLYIIKYFISTKRCGTSSLEAYLACNEAAVRSLAATELNQLLGVCEEGDPERELCFLKDLFE
jgi:hypothetical protein